MMPKAILELPEIPEELLKEKNPLEDIIGNINEEQICDGNCKQCQCYEEMPEELRNLFDKILGGNK